MNKNLFKAPKNIYKWEFEKGRQTRSEKQTEEEKKIEDRNEKRKKNRINIVEIPVFVGLPVVMWHFRIFPLILSSTLLFFSCTSGGFCRLPGQQQKLDFDDKDK